LLTVRGYVGRGLRQRAVEIALFPPGAVVLSGAVLATGWRALRGKPIEWRGRAYATMAAEQRGSVNEKRVSDDAPTATE
jgi:hypothetical protein